MENNDGIIQVQMEIEKILKEEFEAVISKNMKNPLIKILLEGNLNKLDLDEISRKILKEDK